MWWFTKRRNLKPLYLTWQEGITREDLEGIFRGLKTTKFILGEMGDVSELRILKKGDCIRPAVEQARLAAKKHPHPPGALFAETLWMWQKHDQWQDEEPHDHLTVVRESLYFKKNNQFVACGGVCFPDSSISMVTLHHFAKEKKEIRDICNWVLTIHEIGHRYHAVPDDRTNAVQQDVLAGAHCANECIMQRNLPVAVCLNVAKKPYPFCIDCLKYMKRYVVSHTE